MQRVITALLPIADIILAPFIYPAAIVLALVRKAGVHHMPLCKKALTQVGVFPILNHYNEPLFTGASLKSPLEADRELPGIDWNVPAQLKMLQEISFASELAGIPQAPPDDISFYFNNGSFESGDAEFLYSLIRHKKPARIFEIGSGNSTLMAMKAVRKNREEDPRYKCEHLCFEPYERPWLEKTGVTVVRQLVEDAGKERFAELKAGDLLFVDSSHMIRPQGDVLFEYLELLPTLRPGVMVHIHDIFSPRDYPREWVVDQVKFWNEQYLVEAFLTCNSQWSVMAALNYLHNHHFDELKVVCPYLTPDAMPGSLYLEKIG